MGSYEIWGYIYKGVHLCRSHMSNWFGCVCFFSFSYKGSIAVFRLWMLFQCLCFRYNDISRHKVFNFENYIYLTELMCIVYQPLCKACVNVFARQTKQKFFFRIVESFSNTDFLCTHIDKSHSAINYGAWLQHIWFTFSHAHSTP